MAKIEKHYVLNKEPYHLIYDKNNVQVFKNEESDVVLITHKSGNMLFNITASCAQNIGFLERDKDEIIDSLKNSIKSVQTEIKAYKKLIQTLEKIPLSQ